MCARKPSADHCQSIDKRQSVGECIADDFAQPAVRLKSGRCIAFRFAGTNFKNLFWCGGLINDDTFSFGIYALYRTDAGPLFRVQRRIHFVPHQPDLARPGIITDK